MKKLYFLNCEDKERAEQELKEKSINLIDVPPYFSFDYDAFVTLDRKQLATTPEFYFEALFEEDAESKTIIISDGLRYLPAKIAEIVLRNGWFCVAIRQIAANTPYSEEISLAIYYDDTARFHFADMIHPAGPCSEIFALYGEAYSSYIVAFNLHPLVIGNDDDYGCKVVSSTQRLSSIDFTDSRGIDYLAQCLNYLSRQK